MFALGLTADCRVGVGAGDEVETAAVTEVRADIGAGDEVYAVAVGLWLGMTASVRVFCLAWSTFTGWV